MTIDDFDEFSDRLKDLADFFEKSFTAQRVKDYFGVLADLSLDDIAKAMHVAKRDLTWFPKPVEIRGLIEGNAEDQAATAWNLAIEAHRRAGDTYSVAFEDGVIGEAIKTVFGGWLQFCEAMHQVWGTADVSYEEREAARLERREAEGRRYLISGLSDEMVASKRKEFIVAYRTAKRTGQRIHYFAGQCEVSNRMSAGNWSRGELAETYSQKVFVARLAGGFLTDALFDRSTGGLVGGVERLLEAPESMKQLPPPAQKYLPAPPEELPTVEESQASYKEGFREMMERMKMPEPHQSLTPEEIEARRALIQEQLKAIKEAEEETKRTKADAA